MLIVTGVLIGLLIGVVGVLLWFRSAAGSRAAAADRSRDELLADATRQAEAIRRAADIKAREEAAQVRADLERDLGEQRGRLGEVEARLLDREEELDRRVLELERREQGINDREVHAKQLQQDLKEANERELELVETVGGMTVGG